MSIQSAITQLHQDAQRLGTSSEVVNILKEMRSLLQNQLTIAQDTQAKVNLILNSQNPARDRDIASCLCELLKLEQLFLCVPFDDSNAVNELNNKLPEFRANVQSCCCYLSHDQKQLLESCYEPFEYNCLINEQFQKRFEKLQVVSTALRNQLPYHC